MSSNTSTSGRSAASPSKSRRARQNSSSPAATSAASPPASRMTSSSGQNVMPSPYERQRPESTVAFVPSSLPSSNASRDLPMPGGPSTVTSLQPSRDRSSSSRRR